MKEIKWRIAKRISGFRNLRDINFEFIRGGINIIVGENNTGKTNFLDYIYEENHGWDNFVVSEENYKTEMSPKGLVPSYRDSYSLLELFFPPVCFSYRGFDYVSLVNHFSKYLFVTRFFSDALLHAKNLRFSPNERPREGKLIISYKICYFDLNASTSFLNSDKEESKKKKLELKKVKTRSWEIYYGKLKESSSSFRDHFIIESESEPKEEESGWIPSYEDRENFIKHQDNNNVIYYGFNKNISHPLDKLGSGYLKYETIAALIESLKKEKQFVKYESYQNSEGRWEDLPYPKFAHTPILLMDEPEVFLHPTFISGLANNIKEAEKENITTILTTHSPSFLLHFIDELFNYKVNKVNLTIIQKDENNANLKEPFYFQRIIEEIKAKIEEEYKNFAEKSEDIDNPNFYKDKWKRLLNQETLRVFFSKSILFVEGMSDYIMFNNILREELKRELKEVEIIPIFGKWHYVFFNELAKKLGLNYWFLLDNDRKLDKDTKKENENSKSKRFWEKYGEGKVENGKNGIFHSFRLVINDKEITNRITIEKSKQSATEQISSFLETNKLGNDYFPEAYREWEKRINNLNSKEEISEFIKLMKKETNHRISWFCPDVETFLFGESIKSNKEYNMISKSPDAINKLKKDNPTKLNELRKIFTDFLKVKEE